MTPVDLARYPTDSFYVEWDRAHGGQPLSLLADWLARHPDAPPPQPPGVPKPAPRPGRVVTREVDGMAVLRGEEQLPLWR